MRPPQHQLERRFPATYEEMEQFIAEAKAIFSQLLSGSEQFGAELLLRELLSNAVVHGSKLDSTEEVLCRIRFSQGLLKIGVQDNGEGFAWRSRQDTKAERSASSGRGMEILSLYADRVRFNAPGNCVAVTKSVAIKGTERV